MIRAEQLHARIMDELDLSREMEDEDLIRLIYQVLGELPGRSICRWRKRPLLGGNCQCFPQTGICSRNFWRMTRSQKIMINGTDYIFYEKAGRIWQSDRRFMSREKLEDVIQQIVSGSNRRVNEPRPIVDARLSDGSRVHVVLAPVALNGPHRDHP